MKKMIFAALILLSASTLGYSQDNTQKKQLSQLLIQYYQIKDALVSGDANTASAKATEYIKIANSIDYKLISEGNINALLKDATSISETKDIKIQREKFINLSNNMVILAKAIRLGDQLIYQQYCPMKKASWLSDQQSIKNPYYGNAMLTCGKVVETIKP